MQTPASWVPYMGESQKSQAQVADRGKQREEAAEYVDRQRDRP